MRRRTVSLSLITALMALSFGVLDAAERPPISAYASLPQFEGLDVSQDGDRVLMLRPFGESEHLVVLDLRTQSSKLILASDPSKFLFNWCVFKTDVRIVCSVRAYVLLTAGPMGFDRWYPEGRAIVTRLMAVDADGSNYVQLVPSAVTKLAGDVVWNDQAQDRIVNWLPDDPNDVLIELNREDARFPSVYKLDVRKNTLRHEVTFHPPISDWYANMAGKVALGVGLRDITPHLFLPDGKGYREFDVTRLSKSDTHDILGVSPDGDSVYAAFDSGSGRSALHEVRLRDVSIARTWVDDPEFDVWGKLLWDLPTQRPFALLYQRDYPSIVWFDDAWKAKFDAIDRALPGTRNIPMNWSHDGSVVVFASTSPPSAPVYYLYEDRAKKITKIGSPYPNIPAEALGETKAVRYVARDGLPISAYLTLPPAVEPKKLPTIILPHGGPFARDTGGFDYWPQFFASRGYAVLQPNYRGSIGYGTSFQQAGYGQWGEAMQNDVIDGLKWLVASGVTDPARVCIVGGSYGGYAALVAAYKTPELFRCAVSFAGVADLRAMKQKLDYFQFGKVTRVRLPPDNELDRNSPIANVDRIGVPLLIVHGDQDRVVYIEQSTSFVAALEKAGKPHQFILQPGGDHFLSVTSQRLQLFEAMESFLQAHLAPAPN